MAEKGVYTYDYPRPMVTVDAVVFTKKEGRRYVLMVKRKHEPFQDCWALPGGFVEMDEPLEEAASRELAEETGVTGVDLSQLRAFDDPKRDPRGRSIGIAFIGVANWRGHSPQGSDDASEAAWLPVDDMPPLAFDHAEILRYAEARLDTDSGLLRAFNDLPG